MANQRNVQPDPNHLPNQLMGREAMIYQIRLKGHLDRQWVEWFGGLTITQEANGDTLLAGLVVDQAALFGLLKKVRDLGLPLLAVNCVQAEEEKLQ